MRNGNFFRQITAEYILGWSVALVIFSFTGFSQYPFLGISVQNCPKVYNMICDYFNFFLHFSIAYIKSFQDMYHKFH